MKKIYCFIWSVTLFLGGCHKSPPHILVLQPGQIAASGSDTIYSIAKTHDISVRDLIESNHLTPPYILEEGKILTIPSKNISSHNSAPEDDLDIMTSGPIDLAQETWKDISLEDGNLSPDNSSEAIENDQEKELLPTPTLPLPTSRETKQRSVETVEPEQYSSSAKPHDSSERSDVYPWKAKKKNGPLAGAKKKSLQHCARGLQLLAPVPGGIKSIVDKQTAIFQTKSKEQVLACAEGTVLYAGKCDQFHKDPALANQSFVFISHDSIKEGEWTSVYLGIVPCVKKYQKVKQGQVLGVCKEGPLQFQLRKNRIPVNPRLHLK